MRISTRAGRHTRVSMSLTQWLLIGWLALPLLLCWWMLLGLGWLLYALGRGLVWVIRMAVSRVS